MNSLHRVGRWLAALGVASIVAGLQFLADSHLGGTPWTAAGMDTVEAFIVVLALDRVRTLDARVKATDEAFRVCAVDLARVEMERTAAAAALRRSSDDFVQLLKSSVDAVVLLDEEGGIVGFNPAAVTLFGTSRAEVLGTPFASNLLLPVAAGRAHGPLTRFLLGGRPLRLDRAPALTRPNGGAPSVEVDVTVRRMPGEGPTRYVVTVFDLSGRAAADRDIRERDARFVAILDALVDPVLYLDASATVQLANSASTQTLGEALVGLAPESWAVRLPEAFVGSAEAPDTLRGVLATGQIVRNREVSFEDAAGQPHIALASIIPVLDAGAVRGAVLSLHDVTRRYALAIEVEAARVELRAQYDELLAQQLVLSARTEEVALQRAQLAERNVDLASGSRRKSEFVATMSHELRTPLNAVIGFAEVLLAEHAQPLSRSQREQIREIRGAGHQLLLLINDVLDLSQIEAGRIRIETQRMDLAGPLQQARDLTGPMADARRITVVAEFTPQAVFVAADPDRVRQITLNLLSNALKFTPEGGRVTIQVGEGPAGYARVAVVDTGAGIARDDVAKLFLPFTQLRSGLPRVHTGTGLGLAISRQLAEAMNGTIDCASQPGEGSTFAFTLPLASCDAALGVADVVVSQTVARSAGDGVGQDPPFAEGWAGRRSVVPAAPVAAPPPAVVEADVRARLQVLIVDDNPVNRRVLRSMLAPMVCDLFEAGDGVSAIRHVQEHPTSVILMDLRMPGLDGLGATRALAADPATAGVPVIAITAHDLSGDAERAIEAGCAGYLSKPVGRELLMSTIERVVGRRLIRA